MCTFQHTLFDPGNALCLRISNFNCSDFFLLSKRGAFIVSLQTDFLNTLEHLYSQHRFSVYFQIFSSFCIGMWVPSSPLLPPNFTATADIQQREKQERTDLHTLTGCADFQYKIAGLLYCIKVRVLAWKGCFIDIELKTQALCNGS